MQISIGNFALQKADGFSDNPDLARVRIVANQLTLDKEEERILPEAFDTETIQALIDYGVLDWHHESIKGRTAEDRARAVIGKPTDFKWENNLPVFYGYLNKKHNLVKESMLPHLEAGLPLFAASLGGTKHVKRVYNSASGKIEKHIPKMELSHIAITHAPYVMNPGKGAQVSLIKAESGNSLEVHFPTLQEFVTTAPAYFDKEIELTKALTIGTERNPEQMTGGDAIRPESLEGAEPSHRADYHTFLKTIMAIKNNEIGPSWDTIRDYLEKCNKPLALATEFKDAIDTYMHEIKGGKRI